MPALAILIPQILQGIQIAITAAPELIKIVDDVKAMFAGWFGKGVITVEQQNAVHAYLDAIVAMSQAGIVPPAWQVQPDPVSATATALVQAVRSAPPPPYSQPALPYFGQTAVGTVPTNVVTPPVRTDEKPKS